MKPSILRRSMLSDAGESSELLSVPLFVIILLLSVLSLRAYLSRNDKWPAQDTASSNASGVAAKNVWNWCLDNAWAIWVSHAWQLNRGTAETAFKQPPSYFSSFLPRWVLM